MPLGAARIKLAVLLPYGFVVSPYADASAIVTAADPLNDVPLKPVPIVSALAVVEPAGTNKLVPTPAAAAVKSIYTPRAEPPCSKIRNLFCQTSIVTPVPEKVLLV